MSAREFLQLSGGRDGEAQLRFSPAAGQGRYIAQLERSFRRKLKGQTVSSHNIFSQLERSDAISLGTAKVT